MKINSYYVDGILISFRSTKVSEGKVAQISVCYGIPLDVPSLLTRTSDRDFIIWYDIVIMVIVSYLIIQSEVVLLISFVRTNKLNN